MIPDEPQLADQALAARAATSATVLAGVIAAQMLDQVGRPGMLPTLMWPEADPDLVQVIWDAALAVGYRAGKVAGSSRWDGASLRGFRTALADAGYTTMAGTVQATMDAAPSQHPGDAEAVRTRSGNAPGPWGQHR